MALWETTYPARERSAGFAYLIEIIALKTDHEQEEDDVHI